MFVAGPLPVLQEVDTVLSLNELEGCTAFAVSVGIGAGPLILAIAMTLGLRGSIDFDSVNEWQDAAAGDVTGAADGVAAGTGASATSRASREVREARLRSSLTWKPGVAGAGASPAVSTAVARPTKPKRDLLPPPNVESLLSWWLTMLAVGQGCR